MKYDNIVVCTFGKGTFIESQKKLKENLISLGIKNQVNFTDNDLPDEFKTEHKELFKRIKGYGYYIWKPFLISKILKTLDNDKILIYIDSTDKPSINFFNFVINHFDSDDNLFINRGYNHGQWTKRDCFYYMNCDNNEYYNKVQLEAGIIGMKNTNQNLEILSEWYEWMKNPNILTDDANICGLPNLPNFMEHRHDQSILTNMIIEKNIKNYFLSKDYLLYNYYQPRHYTI